jgi:hypothetical protein
MPRLIAPYSVREHTIGDCNRTPSLPRPPMCLHSVVFECWNPVQLYIYCRVTPVDCKYSLYPVETVGI